MFRLPLSACVASLNAQLKGDDCDLSTVSIDTRTLQRGDVYVAIRGERFDGHTFIEQALNQGARAIVADAAFEVGADGIDGVPVLHVSDARKALGGLATLWSQGHQVPTVAITGSNGKTSVKEMLASILGQLGPTLATQGNLNNDIGVPLTLLSLRAEHQYAVVEMGANHPGEIAGLSAMTKPDVALVNNIGAAHLEGFGSIDAVAKAKSEIYSGVASGGFGVVNLDDQFASSLEEAVFAAGLGLRTFGFSEDADVQGIDPKGSKPSGFGHGASLQMKTLDQTWSTPFSLMGRHSIANALAATAAAQCLDIQREAIVAGLKSVHAVPGRLQTGIGIALSTVIDDTYNANPSSARVAIDVLAGFSGDRHLVLGDMAELGEQAEAWHADVGNYAKECGIDHLWTTGSLARHASTAFFGSRHFDTQAELLLAIEQELSDSSTVLVKGSRSSQMEVVVRALTDAQTRDTSSVTIDLAEGIL